MLRFAWVRSVMGEGERTQPRRGKMLEHAPVGARPLYHDQREVVEARRLVDRAALFFVCAEGGFVCGSPSSSMLSIPAVPCDEATQHLDIFRWYLP